MFRRSIFSRCAAASGGFPASAAGATGTDESSGSGTGTGSGSDNSSSTTTTPPTDNTPIVFPNLFSPLVLGVESSGKEKMRLPHRIIMSPMYMGWEEELKKEKTEYWESMAAFYETRVRGGANLVISGATAPSLLGRWYPKALSMTTHDTAKGYRQVTDAVHNAGGKILCQLVHGGRSAFSPWSIAADPTAPKWGHPYQWARPIQAPTFTVNYLVSEFERGTRLAVEAGFDGVEISAADGSFLHNFICKAHNHREDKYGGEIEARMKILMDTLVSLQYAIPKDSNFVVSCRLSLHDLVPDGNEMWETKLVAETVAKSGLVDLITTSVGCKESEINFTSSYVPKATFSKCTKIVRDHLIEKECHIPIAASHRINDPTTAEQLLEQKACDAVMMGRALLAEPQFVNNAKVNLHVRSAPCIGCNHCFDRMFKAQRVKCAVNPMAGLELERKMVPVKKTLRIAVIGAGPAGITCALTLSRRGHTVMLYERSNEIGGQLNLAKLVPGKEEYYNLLDHWTRELRESNVILKLGSEFVREDVTSSHQMIDKVVLCIGSQPRQMSDHHIIGASARNVVSFEDVLTRKAIPGNKVAIIGNGPIAWDIASYLLHDHRINRDPELYCREFGVNLGRGTTEEVPMMIRKNNREVMMFQRPATEPNLPRTRGYHLKRWLRLHNMDVSLAALFTKIDREGIQVCTPPPDQIAYYHKCESVVWAFGMMPNFAVGTWIYEWYYDGAAARGQTTDDLGIYLAGSCRDCMYAQGNGEQDLLKCVHEGYEIGIKL